MCVTEAFVKQPNLPEGRVRLAVVSDLQGVAQHVAGIFRGRF